MDHATPSPMRNWGITLLYNFAFKSNYGSWIYKIRQIYESPVDHSFCYEYRRDSFCIWKRRWNSSKKFSEQVIWPILKNFHLIRGCVLSYIVSTNDWPSWFECFLNLVGASTISYHVDFYFSIMKFPLRLNDWALKILFRFISPSCFKPLISPMINRVR